MLGQIKMKSATYQPNNVKSSCLPRPGLKSCFKQTVLIALVYSRTPPYDTALSVSDRSKDFSTNTPHALNRSLHPQPPRSRSRSFRPSGAGSVHMLASPFGPRTKAAAVSRTVLVTDGVKQKAQKCRH